MASVNSQEKKIDINGLNINYKTFGNENIPIVILHGWGIDSDKYAETTEQLLLQSANWRIQAKIIIPDLPGFGRSDEPKANWKLDDYVKFVDKFIETATRKKGFELIKNILKNFDPKKAVYIQKKDKIILIGHSFGGRIAIKYAIKHPEKIERLILTGAAGIKHPLDIKQKIFFATAKIGKKIFLLPALSKLNGYAKKILYKAAKEKDYHAASPRMKEIMKNAIGEDLTPVLSDIKIPTLILWGRDDHSTPLSDGNIMSEKIENSEMIIIDDANHSLPYQKPEEFAKAVVEFIKKEV